MPTPIKTQAELDAAIAARPNDWHIVAEGRFSISIGRVEAWGNASVEARENASVEARGNASVVAWGNASVEARGNASVVAWGNASVVAWGNASVEARENASVEARENASVEAWGNASVEAWGNASVEARENASVEAWGNVFVRLFSALKITVSFGVIIAKHGEAKTLTGGQIVECKPPLTAKEWCEHHGIAVKDGVALVFKGVNAEFHSEQGGVYTPGSTPVAPDWDGGKAECGGGLHFSPLPQMTHEFCTPIKFVACPVALADMRAPQEGDDYPNKIKARGAHAPVYEVDKKGDRVAPTEKAA
jgi:hypothetical protein